MVSRFLEIGLWSCALSQSMFTLKRYHFIRNFKVQGSSTQSNEHTQVRVVGRLSVNQSHRPVYQRWSLCRTLCSSLDWLSWRFVLAERSAIEMACLRCQQMFTHTWDAAQSSVASCEIKRKPCRHSFARLPRMGLPFSLIRLNLAPTHLKILIFPLKVLNPLAI